MLTITLDIFSGLPNPTWTLSDTQVADLTARLGALTPAAQAVAPPPLGYRGFIIEGGTGALAGPLIVYRDGVTGPGVTWRDPNRDLETWLLGTADPPLEQSIRDMVVSPGSP